MTLTERIALMRRMFAQMRAIRARLNPLMLARVQQRAEVPAARPVLRATALRCLAERSRRPPLPGPAGTRRRPR